MYSTCGTILTKFMKGLWSRSLLSVLLTLTLLSSFFGLTSCTSALYLNSTSTPYVIITAMLAEANGQLVEKDGCLRLIANEEDPGHTLVWPADFKIEIENDQVRVTSGIVSGNRQETTLKIGEMVTLSGGEYVDEQLKKTIPSNCDPPYWVVGSIMKHTPSTQAPE